MRLVRLVRLGFIVVIYIAESSGTQMSWYELLYADVACTKHAVRVALSQKCRCYRFTIVLIEQCDMMSLRNGDRVLHGQEQMRYLRVTSLQCTLVPVPGAYIFIQMKLSIKFHLI